MLKIIQKYLDFSITKISAIFALLYFLLFDTAVILYKLDYYNSGTFSAILQVIKEFVVVYISLFILFFGLSISRLLFLISVPVLFLTGGLASYYLYCFKILPTKYIIEAVFNTNFNETYELISIKLIVWLLFSLFVSVYTMIHFKVTNTKLFSTKILSALCLLITVNLIIMPSLLIPNKYFPIQYLHNTYLYFLESYSPISKVDISKKYTFINNATDDTVGVLVIGESARFDHFGINGYERNTTPKLSNISNLYSFKAKAFYNLTHKSVWCLLSCRSCEALQEASHETSFLSVLTSLGFNTSWISNQTATRGLRNLHTGMPYDEVNFLMLPTLSQKYSHDGLMLPYIHNIIDAPGKKFVVIHTTGSHWRYSERYPEVFARFKPEINKTFSDPISNNLQTLINSYDNTILYTDFFLSSIIDLLKDKNSFFIYVSDHGESLGENDRYSHGGDITEEQITVPFMVWVSDRFKTEHPDSVSAIKTHYAIKKEINHDYVFHTIFDCLNIESEIVDKNLSLCRGHNQFVVK